MDEGAGKGDKWRPIDRQKYDDCPLWKSKCCNAAWSQYYVVNRYVWACVRCGRLKTPEQGVEDVTALLRKERGE